MFRYLCCFLLFFFSFSFALEFPMPAPGDDVVGQLQRIYALKGDTLSTLGMRYNIGYYEMLEANPELADFKRSALPAGTEVLIPSFFILPKERRGLVANLAELRVYYFSPDGTTVNTFPIGAGREGWNTPIMTTRLVLKKEKPTWTVPSSIMKESIKKGKPLKASYPPGPDNPLGEYALYLAYPGILFHGTNLPATVGTRVSHGCMRLLPDDIKFLYDHVPVGTTVTITHDQVKAGWLNHQLYLEAEIPFTEYHDSQSPQQAVQAAIEKRPSAVVDQQRLQEVVEEEKGIPLSIGHD